MSIMKMEQFSFAYPDGTKVLNEIDLNIEAGEFLLLCGPSGSGKTTLLRCLKSQIAPLGARAGSVTELPPAEVGFVFQNPDNQIVTDTVRHELAFGLENMGLPTNTIRRRVAETALFFGIDEWIDSSVYEISGGQKQLLNLASVIAMRPKVLILDEPTSQLDPVARKNFLELLIRANRELGIAVLLSEHQLQEVLQPADRVFYMENGALVFGGDKDSYVRYIIEEKSQYAKALPAAANIAREVQEYVREHGMTEMDMREYNIPLTVREGRSFLERFIKADPKRGREAAESIAVQWLSQLEGEKEVPVCLHVDHIWYRYQKQTPFVLKGLDIHIGKGEVHAVLGGNGSGKTTLLYILGKRLYANRGKIRLGKERIMPAIGLLPQNPKSMFGRDTVEEELRFAGCGEELRHMFRLEGLMERHPYDLSGGEQQRLGLALVLADEPDLLLLDEPTKGLDSFLKEELADCLQSYAKKGRTILFVTHDIEFASAYADRCSLLFNGEVLATEPTKRFFSDNAFYTTDAVRILRGYRQLSLTEQKSDN